MVLTLTPQGLAPVAKGDSLASWRPTKSTKLHSLVRAASRRPARACEEGRRPSTSTNRDSEAGREEIRDTTSNRDPEAGREEMRDLVKALP
jgi:hypothetical protein